MFGASEASAEKSFCPGKEEMKRVLSPDWLYFLEFLMESPKLLRRFETKIPQRRRRRSEELQWKTGPNSKRIENSVAPKIIKNEFSAESR